MGNSNQIEARVNFSTQVDSFAPPPHHCRIQAFLSHHDLFAALLKRAHDKHRAHARRAGDSASVARTVGTKNERAGALLCANLLSSRARRMGASLVSRARRRAHTTRTSSRMHGKL